MANDDAGGRREPRYREVADTLIGEISAGQFAVGDRLPGELELTRRFGVSRHTVREALRLLEQHGMVGRRPGVGTVVRKDQAPTSTQHRLVSINEFLRYPGETRLHLIGSALLTLGTEQSSLLHCPEGEQRLRLSGVRRCIDDGMAICWTEIYLLPAYGAIAGMIGQDARPVYRLIEERFGERPRHVEVQLGAAQMNAEQARALDVAEGSPSLRVVRRYRNAGDRPYEVSVSDHPADRISYTLGFQPDLTLPAVGD
ncbi:MAG: GntR family transcriptional regulator [Gammaproteobacteria bacterium]|nr:GntR family transcriptional regulator [Gammaproteobacteria bacterium]TVQ47399.1 MAG: GntR family transcriptional regulator [Gammaproteobacteria bacterium]